MQLDSQQQRKGQAHRHDEQVVPGGLQQFEEKREDEVKLEQHDHHIQLVVAAQ